MSIRRHELTDLEWEKIKLALPNQKAVGRPGADTRTFLNAVIWIAKTGSPWRDLPERFGSWIIVFQRFSYWSKKDYFKTIFEKLQDSVDDQETMIDSTVVKCHQSSAGAKKKNAEILKKLASLLVD